MTVLHLVVRENLPKHVGLCHSSAQNPLMIPHLTEWFPVPLTLTPMTSWLAHYSSYTEHSGICHHEMHAPDSPSSPKYLCRFLSLPLLKHQLNKVSLSKPSFFPLLLSMETTVYYPSTPVPRELLFTLQNPPQQSSTQGSLVCQAPPPPKLSK